MSSRLAIRLELLDIDTESCFKLSATQDLHRARQLQRCNNTSLRDPLLGTTSDAMQSYNTSFNVIWKRESATWVPSSWKHDDRHGRDVPGYRRLPVQTSTAKILKIQQTSTKVMSRNQSQSGYIRANTAASGQQTIPGAWARRPCIVYPNTTRGSLRLFMIDDDDSTRLFPDF